MKVNFAELLASFLVEIATNMHSLILSKKEIEELLKVGYLEKYKDAYRITDGADKGYLVFENKSG